MTKIDEFITLLESNKANHQDKKRFIESLNKKEFITFLSKDFSPNSSFSDLFPVLGNISNGPNDISEQSIEVRTDLFEEYINQTEDLINKYNIEELKKALAKIKTEYITIRNMILERLILLIHNSTTKIDTKKIIEFKHRVEQRLITHEDIRDTLLKMPTEEFSFFICVDNQESQYKVDTISTPEIELENMYEYQAQIIAEIIESYTEEEIIELIPLINNSSNRIRKMLFKCLNEKKASEIFLTNASKYSNDIYNYVLSPTLTDEKDTLIVEMLSNPELYNLYAESDITYLKALIANGEVFLDESSNIVNTYDEDIISEAAKHIANIKGRDKPNIKRGILKKLSSKKLYNLLIEVNKGLENIDEDIITIQQLISLMEIPLDKTILFLDSCVDIKEADKKNTLKKVFPDNEYQTLSIEESSNKIIEKCLSLVINNKPITEEFIYIYKDLLELDYKEDILNQIIDNYSKLLFTSIPLEYLNIFFSQLVQKEIELLSIDVTKEFYVGKISSVTPQRTCIFNPKTKVLSINSNILNRELLDITNALESIYYELRKIYQKEAISYISNMKDFYLLLDTILHKETFSNPEEDHEIDAKLYSKVKVLDLLKNKSKEKYLETYNYKMKGLASKRKSSILRGEKTKNIVDSFFNNISSNRIVEIKENYPMLDLIVDDNGNRLKPSELQNIIKELEHILTTEDISDHDYEQGEIIINFIAEYLKKIYKIKAVRKKLI